MLKMLLLSLRDIRHLKEGVRLFKIGHLPQLIYLQVSLLVLDELAGVLVGGVGLGPALLGAVPVDET